MFKVSTKNLSADLTHAGILEGSRDLGEFSREQIAETLEKFRHVNTVENLESEPKVVVTTPKGKFIIETEHGKLFATDSHDLERGSFELTPGKLTEHLGLAPTVATHESSETPVDLETPSSARHWIGAVIVVLILAINGYTAFSFLSDRVVRVDSLEGVTFVEQPSEVAARLAAMAGTYSTGGGEGSRMIKIRPDALAIFSVVSDAGQAPTESVCRVATNNGKPCLVTADRGLINVIDKDTVELYRDVYRRIQ